MKPNTLDAEGVIASLQTKLWGIRELYGDGSQFKALLLIGDSAMVNRKVMRLLVTEALI